MDEPKKQKTPILGIWRRLMKWNKKPIKSEEKKEKKQEQNTGT
jgi:hypothetical protein